MKYLQSINFFKESKQEEKVITVQDYIDEINNTCNLKNISNDIMSAFKRYDFEINKMSKDHAMEKNFTGSKFFFHINVYESSGKQYSTLSFEFDYKVPFNIDTRSIINTDNYKFTDGDRNRITNTRDIKLYPGCIESCMNKSAAGASISLQIDIAKDEPEDVYKEAFEFLINKYGFKFQYVFPGDLPNLVERQKELHYNKTIIL